MMKTINCRVTQHVIHILQNNGRFLSICSVTEVPLFSPPVMSSSKTAVEFAYLSVASGAIAAVVIAIIGTHSIYHEQQNKFGSKLSRALSIMFFSASFMSSIGYAFFRSNFILPMGENISCLFGYYWTTNAIFMSKTLLFSIFLYRVHLVFGKSGLAYSPFFLKCILLSYIILISTGNVLFTIASYSYVHLFRYNTTFGICTTGTLNSKNNFLSMVMISLFVGDVTYSIFVCGLFVNKLRQTINGSTSDASKQQNDELILLSRKQTILVIFACVSSLFTLGMSARIAGISLLVSFDTMTNAICVWFMYNFNKNKWNMFIKYVCFCWYCCFYKPNIEMSLSNSITSKSAENLTDKIDQHKIIRQSDLGTRTDDNDNSNMVKTNEIEIEITNNQSKYVERAQMPQNINSTHSKPAQSTTA